MGISRFVRESGMIELMAQTTRSWNRSSVIVMITAGRTFDTDGTVNGKLMRMISPRLIGAHSLDRHLLVNRSRSRTHVRKDANSLPDQIPRRSQARAEFSSVDLLARAQTKIGFLYKAPVPT